jgi:hypothetical protein
MSSGSSPPAPESCTRPESICSNRASSAPEKTPGGNRTPTHITRGGPQPRATHQRPAPLHHRPRSRPCRRHQRPHVRATKDRPIDEEPGTASSDTSDSRRLPMLTSRIWLQGVPGGENGPQPEGHGRQQHARAADDRARPPAHVRSYIGPELSSTPYYRTWQPRARIPFSLSRARCGRTPSRDLQFAPARQAPEAEVFTTVFKACVLIEEWRWTTTTHYLGMATLAEAMIRLARPTATPEGPTAHPQPQTGARPHNSPSPANGGLSASYCEMPVLDAR